MAERYRLISLIPGRRSEFRVSIRDIDLPLDPRCGLPIIDARHAVSPIRFPRSPTRRYAEPPTRFHSGPLCVRMAERHRLISLIPGRRSEFAVSIRDI